MSAALRLRLLQADDLAFADSLRALAGWNQTLRDWNRFLALEPEGCFLAEWNGAPAGTATTTVYGPQLAWIGMVLVHPDHRRRGIGRALLEWCIGHVRERGVRCVKLDATPAGKKVYDGLGFKDEWTLTRWQRTEAPLRSIAPATGMKDWREVNPLEIERLDAMAFGVSRRELVRKLAEASRRALVLKSEEGQVAATGLSREGADALYLGPVAGASAHAGLLMVEQLLNSSGGSKVIWDIPDDNTAAVAWAKQHGFIEQRTLTRMYLGENSAPGDPRMQFAIAGPELG
jgi:GNAT superfamily N-acetyltransferase